MAPATVGDPRTSSQEVSSFDLYNFLDMIVAATKMASFAHDEISNCLHCDNFKFWKGSQVENLPQNYSNYDAAC